MIKREGGSEGDVRGVAVIEDDGQSAAPGGSWKRPDAVAGRGQVRASGVVPSRPRPGLGEKHELYVFVGDEGVNFCSFLGAVDRTSVEQSDGNVVGKSGLGLQRDRDQVVEVYGRRHSEISLRSDWENTGGNEINRSPFLQILATTARAFTW